ncbi:N-terminal domain of NEFA-interacting nuclear protein NIP30-domain-containing protein [Halteromyces radiatus]|uniref:N-terminal domain of NEFA-interacting nuclear protein NIP30-domain-containing protein n=1 Tax=Halteromyces radiatus TaxID=101107 RepID=UPI00221FBC49|nr:N-terminal domain of NEFA-interacting nuclear protein NIP30-domain-containing protein [Halteromyces radiatus]KAI8092965.1 N-terminal domain of NEFA-interacting nuclear protein NIP30-domain-containing protein [Halteromyces radiatus]
MSFKSFVSHSVINNDEEQIIDNQKESIESTQTPQAEYDPRTLYERLQEQKNKKEEEFREATRFSNLVKRIDPEEAAYYKSLSDTQKQLDEDLKLKEMQELEEYRRAVEQARTATTNGTESTIATTNTNTTNTSTATVKRKSSQGNVVKKPKKDAIAGLVLVKKKKREQDEMEDNDNKIQQEPTNKKVKIDNENVNKDDKSSKTTALGSLLAAYNDDDSDSNSD